MKGLERLSVIRKISQKKPANWVHKDLFRILHKEDVWISAYQNIKGNKGALILGVGITKSTLDRIGLEKLRLLQKSVINESYKFNPRKQIMIPKPNGKRRHLVLPTPNDKIVQEVIRMVLESVYEPIFDNRSFGFRSGMGVHDALQQIEKDFKWVDWVIKGDIQNAYPIIDQKILYNFISQKIEDQRFMNLIQKSLKCGIDLNPQTISSKLGVAQENIVAPFYVNIYFNEIDKWITEKEKEIYSEKSLKRTPEYKKIEYQIKKVAEQLKNSELDLKQRKILVQEIKQLIQKRNLNPSFLNPRIRLSYIRYADDWIIGIRGPKNLAVNIKEEVRIFLKTQLKQHLDPLKTKIINLRAGKLEFLGYEIFFPRNMKLTKYKKKDEKITIRRFRPKLRFHIPLIMVRKRLQERGYIACVKKDKFRPISKRDYSPLEDEVIVNHFNSVWLGLLNFYSGVTNWSNLQYIYYLLHMSCAMTLAHRHKTTNSRIFEKHGKRLEIMDKTGDTPKVIASFPYPTKWKISNRKWQLGKPLKDPFAIYANPISKS
jgi:group II intron reverse transcriptase/maturase